jgi:hypothetical protein
LVQIQLGPIKLEIFINILFFYIPAILLRTAYRPPIIPKIRITKKIRNLGTLNKFRKGAMITKADPITLVIKNRG